MLRRIIAPLAVSLAIIGLSGETAKAASACENELQGKIAWDYSGSTGWAQRSINKLCAGAESSVGPANCFQTVMHSGRVNWGGGTQWKWKNAVDLCRGAKYATARVTCFQNEVGAGKSWEVAIINCRWSGTEKKSTYKDPNFSTLQGGTPVLREQRKPTKLKLVQNGWYVVQWEVQTKKTGYLPSVALSETGVTRGVKRTIEVKPDRTVSLKATRGKRRRVIVDADVKPYGCIILSGTVFNPDWTWKERC